MSSYSFPPRPCGHTGIMYGCEHCERMRQSYSPRPCGHMGPTFGCEHCEGVSLYPHYLGQVMSPLHHQHNHHIRTPHISHHILQVRGRVAILVSCMDVLTVKEDVECRNQIIMIFNKSNNPIFNHVKYNV